MAFKNTSIKKKRQTLVKTDSQLEDEIEIGILKALERLGYFAWKNEYPGRFIGKRYISAKNGYVISGFPDVEMLEQGQSFFFEVKTPKEKAKILRNYSKYKMYRGKNKDCLRYRRQILVMEELQRRGGICGFVDCLNDCLDMIKRWRNEKRNL